MMQLATVHNQHPSSGTPVRPLSGCAVRAAAVAARRPAPTSAVRSAAALSAFPGRLRFVPWRGQRWSGQRSVTCSASLKEEVTLKVDGDEVVARKALLAEMSVKLGDMLESDASCKTLQVEGSPMIWQFVSEYPMMLNKDRNARLKPNDIESVRMAAELLPVAIKYEMPKLLQECEDIRSQWTFFAPSGVDVPTNPVWWIHFAVRHDCHSLAEPAFRAMAVNPQRAWVVTQLLPAVIEAGMPQLIQECEDVVLRWHTFSHEGIAQGKDDPTSPIWWIRQAVKYDRLKLLQPAVKALEREWFLGTCSTEEKDERETTKRARVFLAAELLPVAIEHDMPELQQKCEKVLSNWTSFSFVDLMYGRLDDPSNPLWWINLAAKHDRLVLAAPAIRFIISIGSNRMDAVSRVLAYGQQQRGQLWQFVCSILKDSR